MEKLNSLMGKLNPLLGKLYTFNLYYYVTRHSKKIRKKSFTELWAYHLINTAVKGFITLSLSQHFHSLSQSCRLIISSKLLSS